MVKHKTILGTREFNLGRDKESSLAAGALELEKERETLIG